MSRMRVAGIMSFFARSALVLSVALMLGVAGCGGTKTKNGDGGGGSKKGDSRGNTKRERPVSEEDKARLDEARKAAEEAERQLSELRLERIELESGR